MFGSGRHLQHHPIGLDIGSEAVKLIQLRNADAGLSIGAAARSEFESPEAIGRAIRAALRSADFVVSRVVAAVPRDLVHIRALRLPVENAASADPLENVEREAAGTFPFPLTAAQVAYLPAGEVRQGTESRQEIIAVGVAEPDIIALLERLRGARVWAESLEVQPVALYRALTQVVITDAEAEQTAHLLFDIGANATQIIIGRGRDICVIKCVPVGGRQIDAALAGRLQLSPDDVRQLRRRLDAEAPVHDETTNRRDSVRGAVRDALRLATADLLEQATLCLRYFSVSFRGKPPARIWLTGGEANNGELRDLIQSALALPTEPLNVLAGIDAGVLAATTGNVGEWAVALGLALKGVSMPRPKESEATAHA